MHHHSRLTLRRLFCRAYRAQAADAKASAERIAESQRKARERAAEQTAKKAIESAKAKEAAAAKRRKAVANAKNADSGPGKCDAACVPVENCRWQC
jgi:hypothetical protein